MVRVIKEIARDVAALSYHLATAAILLSGFIVCIGLAAYLTYAVLGDPAQGRAAALTILSLKGSGLGESTRMALETLNYFSFGLIAVYAISSGARYLRNAAARKSSSVIEFQTETFSSSDFGGPTVANL
jgi:hypothetical protein